MEKKRSGVFGGPLATIKSGKGLLQNQAERFQDSLKRQVIQHLMEGYYGYLSEEESQQLLQQKLAFK